MDDILNWHIWMYVAILFFIIELFTPGFIVACLGLGSIAGALSAYLGFDIDYQLISFAVVTTISLFIIRPLLYKKNKSGDLIKTNTDAFSAITVIYVSCYPPNFTLSIPTILS